MSAQTSIAAPVRERPILFSAPMVRAILDGWKTQTRRVIVPQPQPWEANDAFLLWRGDGPFTLSMVVQRSPYGVPGDRLWVRESWRVRRDRDDMKPRELRPAYDIPWYAADPDSEPSGCMGGSGRLRPSMFMPRWASRITLELADVRVQRLQEISEEDARAEGISWEAGEQEQNVRKWGVPQTARMLFADLWDGINFKRGYGWASNPYVWALTFRRVKP